MQTRRLSRPSLRITRRDDQDQSGSFTFEVWSPFAGSYQPVESIEDGLRRVRDLADLIYQMWLRKHPKQTLLVNVPEADRFSGAQWAEFRINPVTYRSYDTRHGDRPEWARAAGISQAATMTCVRSGYMLPMPDIS